MQLSDNDVDLFYKLSRSLMLYANQRLGLLEGVETHEDFSTLPPDDWLLLRDSAYADPLCIDLFIEENPFQLSTEELDIVASWEDREMGQFILFRYLKAHTVFLSTEAPVRAFGVKALAAPLDETMPQAPPLLVRMVLLPFKGAIIYDGLLQSYPVFLGPGIKQRLNDDYRKAKARCGIITSLPFNEDAVEESDLDRLKFYLRSVESREMHEYEIECLIEGDKSLRKFYHQDMGRRQSKSMRRKLKKLGIRCGWFGSVEGTVVASGTTRAQTDKALDALLPREIREHAYVFEIRDKSGGRK